MIMMMMDGAMNSSAGDSSGRFDLHLLSQSKIIYLIRHGQALHNPAGEADHANYMKWEFLDARLTEKGWNQAASLLRAKKEELEKAELVVVSPLTRTLETALGIYGVEGEGMVTEMEEAEQQAEDAMSDAGRGQCLIEGHPVAAAPPSPAEAIMAVSGSDAAGAGGAGGGGGRTVGCSSSNRPDGEKKAKVFAGTSRPFVAMELCRERIGRNPCDKRSAITEYKQKFPFVDFSQIETDEDTWWTEAHRETDTEIGARALKFLAWLAQRKERNIAVVSHSAFLFALVNLFGDKCSSDVQKELRAWFSNCEMRSVVLLDHGSNGSQGRSAA
ncbi:hypothetical protein CBR_g23401 [Chara braunii]|uniref:Phosphoglycerate mutase-like protein n=1 Tax=Chara braunii TaxID=69332 RepID=A0A388L440_CHABU|nr:hypothetical protein CBR_g23401 [Chara braunii]|eukprot:GBG77075.1 hypothetical protein CBR_g23401 [Chara braunii]